MSITVKSFGHLPTGEEAQLYTLTNASGASVSITNYVQENHPKYSVTDMWVRKARNKMTYQARISKTSGILWWKKEKDAKILNFEVDGKFISVAE